MSRIGIYGGSFNPPHMGHVLAIKETVKALQLDTMLVIPAATPPHKALSADAPSPAERLELLRLAVAGLEQTQLCELELRRAGPSYSCDTLAQLREQYPKDELFLLMGTDMFLSLDTWRSPEIICRCATVVLASRVANSGKIHDEILAEKEKLIAQFGAKVVILDNNFVEISSSTVRRMLAFHAAESYLAPAVLETIERKGYYGLHESNRNLPFERLTEKSLQLHKQQRRAHVVGCSRMAVALAERWGANVRDAARAGILHDVTKALDGPEQLRLCEKYGILIDTFEIENPKLLHAKTGSVIAKEIFGENEAVCNAIFWHTTGKADMTTLEKILYLADYIEPNRKFDGVDAVRSLAFEDLDAALLLGLNMAMEELVREGKTLGRCSVEARDFLQERKG
ncbi:MAG: nicotinate (nicotinamide) nucleotide adenylyltransferase [Oscillospiraceae bacterium]|nr:nicotinate (nicotinamide) nucleotide adenylyltransferase [Oscillospiraceae bacterium]